MGIGRLIWFCHRVLRLTYLLHCEDEKCRWKNISVLHTSPLTVLKSLLETVQMIDHCVSTIIDDHCEVYGTTDKPFMRAEQKRTQRHHHLHSWKKVSMFYGSVRVQCYLWRAGLHTFTWPSPRTDAKTPQDQSWLISNISNQGFAVLFYNSIWM